MNEKLDDRVEMLSKEEALFTQESELSSAMKNLDSQQELNKNTRLTTDERGSIITLEGLQDTGILDRKMITIGHLFKELAVSIKGEGRKEKVQLAQSVTGQKAKSGFLKNLFSKRGEE